MAKRYLPVARYKEVTGLNKMVPFKSSDNLPCLMGARMATLLQSAIGLIVF